MGNFFKTFFASLLALIVFSGLVLLIMVLFIGGLTSRPAPRITAKTVLMLDLGQQYKEQEQENAFSILSSEGESAIPGLYDLIRLLDKAKSDNDIAGIYLVANGSPNGFAASTEIRNALLDFKKSGKFIYAHGDRMSQKAYSIAQVADKIYLGPQGFLQWFGFSVDFAFVKGTLDKLNIEPQVFYAGRFKSATEPFRTEKMTEENKLQTTVWLNDLYNEFLVRTAEARKIDTSTLHQLADDGAIQSANDAVTNKLVDGIKYDDEVRDEIKTKIGLEKTDRINLVHINRYMQARKFKDETGEKIALIYAEGDIVDGKGEIGVISSENFQNIIRSAAQDNTIKAIVFRINSGGGSALASESIWRELALAKQKKPVVVSFGDVAASGGYYIACAADSIFAQPSTITGSIGVFGIIPNMEAFFKNKLGITFDGVKTGPYADIMSVTRPMNENEKKIIQAEIDRIYSIFKNRVAEGRKKDTAYVDSIAQGRVWTGQRAKDIGLVDRFGGINDAIMSAARMAKIDNYRLKEYPEPINILDRLLGKANPLAVSNEIKEEIGEDNYKMYMEIRRLKEMCNKAQTRLPFTFDIR